MGYFKGKKELEEGTAPETPSGEARSPLRAALDYGLAGTVIGGMGGAAIRNIVAGRKARGAGHVWEDTINKAFIKDPKTKKYTVYPRANSEIFGHPDMQEHVLSDKFKVVKPVMSDVGTFDYDKKTGKMVRGPSPTEFYSKEEKADALKELVNPKPRKLFEGLLDSMFSGTGHLTREIKGNVYNSLQRELDKGGDQLGHVMDRLRAEGITDYKSFSTKYHPDKNPNPPEYVKKNWTNILETLRAPKASIDPMTNFARGFKQRQDRRFAEANQALRNLE